jgi:hypothetical protein
LEKNRVTYTARHVPRAAASTNLLLDRLHRLLRQLLTVVEFHEQHHAFVFPVFRHLTNYEAVRYPLGGMALRSGVWSGKACIKDIVDLGGPEPDATRVPTLGKKNKDRPSA